jgi:hypothetical protein
MSSLIHLLKHSKTECLSSHTQQSVKRRAVTQGANYSILFLTKPGTHAKPSRMKYMLFLFITFSLQLALAAQAVTGFLGKSGNNFYLSPQNSKNKYLVVPDNDEVTSNLSRLSKGDLITGHGSLDTTHKKIRLASVDYVGLRKLLGPWTGGDGTLLFKDFSTMKYSPRFSGKKQLIPFHSYQKEFRYTLSPSDGEEWALFMSDDKSTTFATVAIDNKTIILKIYESESGHIVRTLKLERP